MKRTLPVLLLVAAGCSGGNADLIRKGQAALDRKDLKIAEELFTEAIRKDPTSVAAFIGRAKVRSAASEFDPAIRDATEAIRLDPNAAEAYEIRGDLYRRMAWLERNTGSPESKAAGEMEEKSQADLQKGAALRGN